MCTAAVQLGEHGSESYFSSAASTASMDPGSEADFEKEKAHFYQNDPAAPMQVRSAPAVHKACAWGASHADGICYA